MMRPAILRATARPRPHGFTLMELLITMGVIGLLIAILLPAVQAAREAARRADCRNRIRQLGLALHAYHSAHGMFPLNYGTGEFDDASRGASWLAQILPHLEQRPLYDSIRFGKPLADPANLSAARTPVPALHCPSDSHNGRMDRRANVPGEWAVTNYKACAGSNWAWGPFSPVVTSAGRNAGNANGLNHGTGILCRNSLNDSPPFITFGASPLYTTRFQDITDGTSHTIAVGESVPEWCRHTWWWWFNATTATCAIPLNYQTTPDLQDAGEGDWRRNYGFMSRHAGGANFCLADGGARFIADDISLLVYRRLGTIQGREVANVVSK